MSFFTCSSLALEYLHHHESDYKDAKEHKERDDPA